MKKKRVTIEMSTRMERTIRKIMVQKTRADGIVRFFARACVELIAEANQKYINAGVIKSEGK